MPKRWDVLGIGNVAVDELIQVDEFPQPDTKGPAREVRRQGGGLTATALVAAARQGARAAYCAQLDTGELSAFSLAELEREGVDCSPCVRGAGQPFHSFVIVDRTHHTRTILYAPGQTIPAPEAVLRWVAACQVLSLDHFTGETGVQAAHLAHQLGLPVVADIENDKYPGALEVLEAADHLIVGRALAARLTGQAEPPAMVRALATPQRACCAITAGSAGCWYSARGGPVRHQPAFRVEVLDPTGCGDVFHGAYAAALARGEAVARSIQLASAAAALKATQLGGRAGIPTLAATEQFIARPEA